MKQTLSTFVLAICLLSALAPSSFSAELTLNDIFQDSFTYFQILRQENGIYRDAITFDGNHFHPASIATTGMGLVSLCIADKMSWIPNAEELAETTLKTITGKNPPFVPARNQSGYFRHWLNLKTGAQAWNSEYSSIDSAILMVGASFTKNYFDSPTLTPLVDELIRSIDWSQSIADPTTGGLYREMLESGEGKAGTVSLPFSEYMIVSWMALKEEQRQNRVGPATKLWENFYSNPDQIMTKTFEGIPLLTDHSSHFLSDFTLQFPYYLCHFFNTSEAYRTMLDNALQADQLWWSQNENAQKNEWGLGAGSVGYAPGYHADSINNNRESYYSPHIIAGYLPIYPEGIEDLQALLEKGDCVYPLPDSAEGFVMWRKSAEKRGWSATDIQGIDYSTMLFGLATLPDNCGPDFFTAHNDFIINASMIHWNKQ